jgi:pimeloyl-ACP methyl ester carboxylesterase
VGGLADGPDPGSQAGAGRRRGRPVGYGVAWPPGSGPGDRRPVCLVLHAAAGNERTPFERLRMHHHLAEAAAGPGRLRPGQLGVLGWSMGGAGALRLAEAHPGRLAAVVATSPAVAAAGAEVAVAKGCHDGAFWQRQAPAQLRFLAAAFGG